MDAVNYDTIAYVQDIEAEADRQFNYGGSGSGAPYVLSQMTGAYLSVPDFLDTQHSIDTATDAEAYLARMSAFAKAMDQEVEQVRHDAGLGVVPPDFVLDTTLLQMKRFADTPSDKASLVASVARRAGEKGIAGGWGGRAARLYDDEVLPALRRQMAELERLRSKAAHDAGVARLPEGDAYYAVSLKAATTTDLTSAQAHQLGLDQVAMLTARLDEALRAQGMTQGGAVGAAAGDVRRSQIPLPQHRRWQSQADRRPEREGPGGASQVAGLVRDLAQGEGRDPPVAAGDRGGGREPLRVWDLGWLATGGLLHRPARHRRGSVLAPADTDLSRSHSRPSPAGLAAAGGQSAADPQGDLVRRLW
jgi:hypothetical protein